MTTEEPQIKFRPGPKQRELINLTMDRLSVNQQEAIRIMLNHCLVCPAFKKNILGTEKAA